jgi:hypothetical protein
MGDDRVLRLTLAGGRVPSFRCGGDEHGPGDRTSLPQRCEEGAGRGGTACSLRLQQGLGVCRDVGRRHRDLDLVERDLELLRDHHRFPGGYPLAHFDARHDQDNAAITADSDKAVWHEPIKARRRRIERPYFVQIGLARECPRGTRIHKPHNQCPGREKLPARREGKLSFVEDCITRHHAALIAARMRG